MRSGCVSQVDAILRKKDQVWAGDEAFLYFSSKGKHASQMVVKSIQWAYNTGARKMMYTTESDPGNAESQPPSTGRWARFALQYK